MYLYRKLPSRVLSKTVGKLAARPLSPFMKRMVLGSYVRMFGCKMEEAVEEDINQYTSLLSLFTRALKEEARPINADHPLVCLASYVSRKVCYRLVLPIGIPRRRYCDLCRADKRRSGEGSERNHVFSG